MNIKTLTQLSLLQQIQEYLRKGLKHKDRKKILARRDRALLIIEQEQLNNEFLMKLHSATRKEEIKNILGDLTELIQLRKNSLFPVSYNLPLKDPPTPVYIQDFNNKYYLSYAKTGALSPNIPIPACEGYTTAFLNTLPSIPQQWIFKPYCLKEAPPSLTALQTTTLSGNPCSSGTFTAYLIVSVPVAMINSSMGGLIACLNCLRSPTGETGYATCLTGPSSFASGSSPDPNSLWVLYIPEIYTIGKNNYSLYNLGSKTFLGSCNGCWVGSDFQQPTVNTLPSSLNGSNVFTITI